MTVPRAHPTIDRLIEVCGFGDQLKVTGPTNNIPSPTTDVTICADKQIDVIFNQKGVPASIDDFNHLINYKNSQDKEVVFWKKCCGCSGVVICHDGSYRRCLGDCVFSQEGWDKVFTTKSTPAVLLSLTQFLWHHRKGIVATKHHHGEHKLAPCPPAPARLCPLGKNYLFDFYSLHQPAHLSDTRRCACNFDDFFTGADSHGADSPICVIHQTDDDSIAFGFYCPYCEWYYCPPIEEGGLKYDSYLAPDAIFDNEGWTFGVRPILQKKSVGKEVASMNMSLFMQGLVQASSTPAAKDIAGDSGSVVELKKKYFNGLIETFVKLNDRIEFAPGLFTLQYEHHFLIGKSPMERLLTTMFVFYFFPFFENVSVMKRHHNMMKSEHQEPGRRRNRTTEFICGECRCSLTNHKYSLHYHCGQCNTMYAEECLPKREGMCVRCLEVSLTLSAEDEESEEYPLVVDDSETEEEEE